MPDFEVAISILPPTRQQKRPRRGLFQAIIERVVARRR
jgi:hypothetical protein